MSLADIRRSYERDTLNENSLPESPIIQIEAWVEQAIQAGLPDATAMALATSNADSRPSVRMVLLKECDEEGLVFFTNTASRKGRELSANPSASALFFWPGLERQIRVEGRVSPIPAADSDAYFQSRPLGSRIGAWASPQSREISREALEERVAHYQEKFGDHPPRPPHWGGLRLIPDYVEFWQGRPCRLHDRLAYTLKPDGRWSLGRLAP